MDSNAPIPKTDTAESARIKNRRVEYVTGPHSQDWRTQLGGRSILDVPEAVPRENARQIPPAPTRATAEKTPKIRSRRVDYVRGPHAQDWGYHVDGRNILGVAGVLPGEAKSEPEKVQHEQCEEF